MIRCRGRRRGGGRPCLGCRRQDVRELIERLEANREEVVGKLVSGDKHFEEIAAKLLEALRRETGEIKHLIAQTHLSAMDGDDRKRLKLFKILEEELTSRNKYDGRASKIEGASISGLGALRDLNSSGADVAAQQRIEQQRRGQWQRRPRCGAKQ